MTAETATQIQPALLTIPQVCEYLNIARPTFYNLRASGKFAPLPVNLCSKVLYQKEEIENWVKAGLPHRKQWQVMKREFQNERRR